MNIAPSYFQRKYKKNRTKKEIPSCLIPHLLFVFTQQHEILLTTMVEPCYYRHQGSLRSMVVLSLRFLCPCGLYYLAPPTKTTILCRLTPRGHARKVPVFSGCLWKNMTDTCFFNIKTKADIWTSIKELFFFYNCNRFVLEKSHCHAYANLVSD